MSLTAWEFPNDNEIRRMKMEVRSPQSDMGGNEEFDYGGPTRFTNVKGAVKVQGDPLEAETEGENIFKDKTDDIGIQDPDHVLPEKDKKKFNEEIKKNFTALTERLSKYIKGAAPYLRKAGNDLAAAVGKAEAASEIVKEIMIPITKDVFGIVEHAMSTAYEKGGPEVKKLVMDTIQNLLKAIKSVIVPLVINIFLGIAVLGKLPSYSAGLRQSLNNPKFLSVAAGTPGSYKDNFVTLDNPDGEFMPHLLHAAAQFNAASSWLDDPILDRVVVGACMHRGMTHPAPPMKLSSQQQLAVLSALRKLPIGNPELKEIFEKKFKTIHDNMAEEESSSSDSENDDEWNAKEDDDEPVDEAPGIPLIPMAPPAPKLNFHHNGNNKKKPQTNSGPSFKEQVQKDKNHPLSHDVKPEPAKETKPHEKEPSEVFEALLDTPAVKKEMAKMIKEGTVLDGDEAEEEADLGEEVVALRRMPFTDTQVKNKKLLDSVLGAVTNLAGVHANAMGKLMNVWVGLGGKLSTSLFNFLESDEGQQFMGEVTGSLQNATTQLGRGAATSFISKMDSRDQKELTAFMDLFGNKRSQKSTGQIVHEMYTDPAFGKFVAQGGKYSTADVTIDLPRNSEGLRALAQLQREYKTDRAAHVATLLNFLPSMSYCDSLKDQLVSYNSCSRDVAHETATAVVGKLKGSSNCCAIVASICAGLCTVFDNVTHVFHADRERMHEAASEHLAKVLQCAASVMANKPNEQFDVSPDCEQYADELIAASAASIDTWRQITQGWFAPNYGNEVEPNLSPIEFASEFVCAVLCAEDKTLARAAAAKVMEYCMQVKTSAWTPFSLVEKLANPNEHGMFAVRKGLHDVLGKRVDRSKMRTALAWYGPETMYEKDEHADDPEIRPLMWSHDRVFLCMYLTDGTPVRCFPDGVIEEFSLC